MARTKGILAYGLENALNKLLNNISTLETRMSEIEKALFGSLPAKRGRKPGKGRKRGRKPGRRGRKASAKKCSVPGCKRPHYAKGLCASHYQQKRREKKAK